MTGHEVRVAAGCCVWEHAVKTEQIGADRTQEKEFIALSEGN